MSEHGVNPSGTDHIPRREAPGEGSEGERELTEYEVPEGERDKPGARERERDQPGERERERDQLTEREREREPEPPEG